MRSFPFFGWRLLCSARIARPEFVALCGPCRSSPPCDQDFQLIGIHASRQVVCWVVFSRTMPPLCRRRICMYFRDRLQMNDFHPLGLLRIQLRTTVASVHKVASLMSSPVSRQNSSNIAPTSAAPDGEGLFSSLAQVSFYCRLV